MRTKSAILKIWAKCKIFLQIHIYIMVSDGLNNVCFIFTVKLPYPTINNFNTLVIARAHTHTHKATMNQSQFLVMMIYIILRIDTEWKQFIRIKPHQDQSDRFRQFECYLLRNWCDENVDDLLWYFSSFIRFTTQSEQLNPLDFV